MSTGSFDAKLQVVLSGASKAWERGLEEYLLENFAVSRTPTQVASHARKYFIRQRLSGVKDKRRQSIHDITTVNLAETVPSDGSKPHLINQYNVFFVSASALRHAKGTN